MSLSHAQSDGLCQQRREWAVHWEAGEKQKGYGPLWPDLLLEPSEGRRLRIGYLSADFCNHPVGRFLLPILEHHQREKVEVWGINVDLTVTGLANISKTVVNTGLTADSTVMVRLHV